MRALWMYGYFVLSLVCFVVLTVRYGWPAALLGWLACCFFTGAVAIRVTPESEDEAEETPKGGGKE